MFTIFRIYCYLLLLYVWQIEYFNASDITLNDVTVETAVGDSTDSFGSDNKNVRKFS